MPRPSRIWGEGGRGKAKRVMKGDLVCIAYTYIRDKGLLRLVDLLLDYSSRGSIVRVCYELNGTSRK